MDNFDLSAFRSSDMVLLGSGIRRATVGAGTLEDACRRIVHYLHESLRNPDDQRPDCVLVRFYRTINHDRLPAELQEYTAAALRPDRPRPDMKCLTLMATAGDRPDWNSRHTSAGHRAIPLPSPEAVERLPMVSRLVNQLGLKVSDLLAGDLGPVLPGHRPTSVFHVAWAAGSRYIPEQENFVKPFGVCSAVGFGGPLTSGDLFAIVLFSRTAVPAQTAELLGYLTSDVKIAMGRHANGELFDAPLPAPQAKRGSEAASRPFKNRP